MAFDVDGDGNIIANPLVGWTGAPMLNGRIGIMRLEVAMDMDLQERAAVQLTITAAQARELADNLVKIADRLDANLAASQSQGQTD